MCCVLQILSTFTLKKKVEKPDPNGADAWPKLPPTWAITSIAHYHAPSMVSVRLACFCLAYAVVSGHGGATRTL